MWEMPSEQLEVLPVLEKAIKSPTNGAACGAKFGPWAGKAKIQSYEGMSNPTVLIVFAAGINTNISDNQFEGMKEQLIER